jgi:hypothetical protein
MNIFVLDYDVKKCAKYHVDTHVSKMILESAQMLCTCMNVKKGNQVAPYKTAQPFHPCNQWVMESKANFIWLAELATELHNEFVHRRGKTHKSFEVIEYCLANVDKIKWHNNNLTPFAQVVDDCFKHQDPVQAYRRYYKRNKQHLHKWTKRRKPTWI